MRSMQKSTRWDDTVSQTANILFSSSNLFRLTIETNNLQHSNCSKICYFCENCSSEWLHAVLKEHTLDIPYLCISRLFRIGVNITFYQIYEKTPLCTISFLVRSKHHHMMASNDETKFMQYLLRDWQLV